MKLSENQSTQKDTNDTSKPVMDSYGENNLARHRLHNLLKFLPDPVLAFTIDNKVEYINPEFEKVFGWTLKEVKGKNIKFIPDHTVDQAKHRMKRLLKDSTTYNFETQRYTKDGRILDILINGSMLYDENNKPSGVVLVLRDLTSEKRMAKSNQLMLKISRALHRYQKLGDLIAFINKELQELMSVEGSFILLADKAKDQLYFLSAHYLNRESEKKFKKIRFPADQGVSGRVYTSGKPLIISDVSQCSFFLQRVNDETDLITKSMLSVPLKLKDRTIGVVTVVNRHNGEFDNIDIELLSMVSSTIALPIENTRIHEELRKSYKELKTLNHAKDKVINHLAHELKTPVSVASASMKLLSKRITGLGLKNQSIENIITRGQRNISRILEIQYEVEDLLKKNNFTAYHILNQLLDACKDELTTLFENETENIDIINRVQKSIERIFGPKQFQSQAVLLNEYIPEKIEKLKPEFKHRKCVLNLVMDKTIPIQIPVEILDVTITGLIRNAFEYTPDHGKIDVILKHTKNDPELIITDYGIGFTQEKLYLIFENYFAPPDSIDYSTKNPYDFNAGGRGFDLLRIKIYSESYHFNIKINSRRCDVIPDDKDICPGDIHLCKACNNQDDCLNRGGTSIIIKFQPSNLS